MATFDNFINNLFHSDGWRRCGLHGNNSDEVEKPWPTMIVPIGEDRAEIPVMVMHKFKSLADNDSVPDELAISLHSNGNSTTYKSFAKIMEVVLNEPLISGLVKIKGVDGSDTHIYYATHGALFSESFKPLMMCSWIMEKRPYKKTNCDEKVMWCYAKPIMRIDPDFYLSKYDNVGRFVNKKVLSAVLEHNIQLYLNYSLINIGSCGNSFMPTVEICKCPFETRTTDSPSITTTNSILADTVINNIDDFT